MQKTYWAAFFSGIKGKKPTQTLSLEEFFTQFNSETKHIPIEVKETAPIFAACTFGPEISRAFDNILAMNAIVLDIDKPLTTEEVTALSVKLEQLGLAHVMYSTYSAIYDGYKLRVIVPLATPVSPQKYEKERFAARLGELLGVEIDGTCEHPTHVYFVPSCAPGTEDQHFCYSQNGCSLQEAELPMLKDTRRKKLTSTTEEPKDDVQAVAAEIELNVSDGVPLIYCGNSFWAYIDGVFHRVSVKGLESYAFNDVFRQKIKLSEIRAAISVLKVMGYAENMVEPGNTELVNFDGITVDLRTGKVVENSPEHNLTVRIPHAFDPDAECPLFHAFFDQTLENDPDAEAKKAYLQQWMGYLLMPTTKFQQMLWLVGPGANGKSILTALMSKMLGIDNTAAVPLSSFSERFATSDLHGKLANISDEAGAEYYLNDSTIKAIIGGSPLRAEQKCKDAFRFEPFARLVVSTNHLPRTKDTSHGYFRRIVILELKRIFTKAEQDPDLLKKLEAEMPGIVRFAVEGAGKLLNDGKFVDLPSSDEAVELYMAEANPVRQFVAEALIPDATNPLTGAAYKIQKIALYAIFRDYCQQRGNIAPAAITFGKRLIALGINDTKSNGKTYWLCGINDPDTWRYSDTGIPSLMTNTIALPDDEGLPVNVRPLKRNVPRKPEIDMFQEGYEETSISK